MRWHAKQEVVLLLANTKYSANRLKAAGFKGPKGLGRGAASLLTV